MAILLRRLVGFVIMTVFIIFALFTAAAVALVIGVMRLFGKQPRVIHVRQVNFDLNDFTPRPPPRDVTPKSVGELPS